MKLPSSLRCTLVWLIFLGPTSALFGQVTFDNFTLIEIIDEAAANPYPSDITVTTFDPGSTITDVNVTLHGINHEFPDDIDILLVGPQGQNLIIFSDVGFATPAVDVEITLDDAGAINMPDNGPLVSGTFKPTNIGAGDAFAGAPAPARRLPFRSLTAPIQTVPGLSTPLMMRLALRAKLPAGGRSRSQPFLSPLPGWRASSQRPRLDTVTCAAAAASPRRLAVSQNVAMPVGRGETLRSLSTLRLFRFVS